MKANNTIEAVITTLPAQAEPFIIKGDPEVLLDYATVLQEQDARDARSARVSHSKTAIGHSVLEQPKRLAEGFVGRVAVDIKAKAFDIRNRTDLYGALRQKRHDDKVLGMARELGLITTTHCAKHEKALAELHGLT